MSHRKLELLATWTTSIAIVIGATYLGTNGATFVTAIGYGAVGLMNLEFARIIHYLSTTSLPPRDYQKEVDDYNDRKNRRND